MNPIKRLFGLSCLLTALLIATPVALVQTGCASFGKGTYRATASSQITVEAAMAAWSTYVSAYHPGPAKEQKVKDALDRYKAASLTVVDAAQAYQKAKASGTLDSALTNFNAAIAAASAALADLIGVIQSFGVQVKGTP